MTSNERKIINFLRETKGKAHVRDVARKTNFSSDYARLLCRSLVRAGYIKLENSNIYHLLEKGHGYFENVATTAEESKPVIATANVTMLSDDLISSASANELDEKGEINHQQVDNGKLDKALAELDTPSGKQGEQEERAEEKAQATAILEEIPQAVLASTTTLPERTAEVEKEKKAEPQEIDKIEAKADNPVPAAPLESPEKAVSKEESVKPSGGFGISFKKIVNWFAEKK